MRAAIYARKSTDDDRTEENKSVTRQIERAKAYAQEKGWSVEDEHIYVDDGISGAEFKNRPALLKLLNDLRDFDVIVASELSRLGREQSQTANVLANIYAKGRRVFFYLTDEEVKFDTAADKFMISAITFGAELEREKASLRSRDALSRKAARGYNTGGVVYGYDNVIIEASNTNGERVRSHTEYRINEKQAEVVRSIFQMYADGHGHVVIARTMNGDARYSIYNCTYFQGTTPTSPRKGSGSWAPSSVRAMLYNVRYTGKVPFGQFRNSYRGGTKVRAKQDDFDLIDAPHLRIVSQELWNAVQKRLEMQRQRYLRDTNGNLWGRPESSRHSRYLLSGLARCGICGASIVALSAGAKNGYAYYVCGYNHNRGTPVCSNGHRPRVEMIDQPILEAIEQSVLTPDAVTYVIDRAAKLFKDRLAENPEAPKLLEAELKRVRKELDNYLALIAQGDAPASVLAEIKKRESRIAVLEAEKAQFEAPAPLPRAGRETAKESPAGAYGPIPDPYARECTHGPSGA